MSREIIERILNIEADAERIHDDARLQAAQLTEEAEQAASSLLERAQRESREQARQMIADGKAEAEAERARILAQAEADARTMETIAAGHSDAAVAFVLDQITGRK
ncbi:MAG: hypothetical protein RBT47_10725 [Anaerolineae bacterium]|jgi:vacuolar-type H+-ATPase subunit H|nr:hypothetical protein [Anaerolineae bacterium]